MVKSRLDAKGSAALDGKAKSAEIGRKTTIHPARGL